MDRRQFTVAGLGAWGLMACGGAEHDPTVEYALDSTRVRADSVRLQRVGGGQLDADVRRGAQAGTFDLRVRSAGYRTLDIDLTLAAGAWPAAGLQTLQGVLDGTLDIGGTVRINPLPTGSWLQAFAMIGDAPVRIASASVLEGLALLEPAIEARLPAG